MQASRAPCSWCVGLSAVLCFALPQRCGGQPANAPQAHAAAANDKLSDGDVQGIGDLLRLIVLTNLPHNYENTKQWGGTKEVWAGLDISQDGLRLKTKRHTRTVNHGSWKMYRAWLIDPERQLGLRLENVHSAAGKGLGFDLVVDARLGAFARWSEWLQGVQLYSISADAEASIRLRMRCALGLSLELTRLPPDLRLEPTVADAAVELTDLRLQRISKLDGPLVHELGRGLRQILQDEINDRRPQLVARINRQIEKHREKLRISPRQLIDHGVDRLWQLAGAPATTAPASTAATSPGY